MLTPKKAGYGVLTGPGYVREFDTCTCKHCNCAFIVRSSDPNNPAVRGGFCGKCYAPTCPTCQKKPCKHFMIKLEEMEARDRFNLNFKEAKR